MGDKTDHLKPQLQEEKAGITPWRWDHSNCKSLASAA